MKLKRQAGFSAIEGLLVIIVVALVAFMGFYVYRASNSDTKLVQKSDTANTTALENKGSVKYLAIKELGIKIPLTAKIKDAAYQVLPTSSNFADISTKAFQAAVSACQSTGTAESSLPPIGQVSRYAGIYNKTATPNNYFSKFVKQFPGFYIEYGHPDGGLCSGADAQKNKDAQTLFTKLSPALSSAFQQAKKL